MRKAIKNYLIACVIFAIIGSVVSIIYFFYVKIFEKNEDVLATKYSYVRDDSNQLDAALLVFDKENALLLKEWYQNKDSSLNRYLPVRGNAFYVIPINTKVDVVGYYYDSTIVKVKMSVKRGQLDPNVEGFVISDVLHDKPL